MGLFRTSASSYDAPDIPAGTYVMTCVGLKHRVMPWEGDNERLEWTFSVQGPNGVIEVEKLTSPDSTGPKSMNWAFLSALIGPENITADMDISEGDVVGKSALGTMGIPTKPDGQPGKFQLIGMVPLPRSMAAPDNGQAAAAPAAATVSPIRKEAPTVRAAVGDPDDLPF